MGYTFKRVQHPIRKASSASSIVLQKLRSFLDENEPKLVYLLTNCWNRQEEAITYKELREAILIGDISADLFLEWKQDYTQFVAEHLQPMWMRAIGTAAADIALKFPEWNFEPTGDGIKAWTAEHAAEFVTNVTSTQIQGLRAVVQRAASLDMNVDELSRAIRPMVGLTKDQAAANMRYYLNLIDNGTPQKRAADLSIRYAARQHRYRGYNIARTELAFAYEHGSYEGTKQAQAAGYLGKVEKVWCTADDERVCPICGALEGMRIAMDDDFDFKAKRKGRNAANRKTPPAHPGCRCVVIYEEIEPPET